MAIRGVADIPMARRIGLGWMAVSLIGACAVGLIGKAYLAWHDKVIDDPETVLIALGNLLLHPLVFGMLLAAILAAVMSTLSAQLLVTGASLTEDFYRLFVRRTASEREVVTVGRLSVVAVAAVAMLLAQNPQGSVLSLVSNAWAGFGAAFGPVILLALTWPRMTLAGALAGMVTGGAVVIGWIAAGWSGWLYEIVPGFAAALVAIVGVGLVTVEPSAKQQPAL
jgi:SSS family solute:Na+ symporter